MQKSESPEILLTEDRPLSKNELRELKTDKNNFSTLNRIPLYIILDSLKCAHNIGTILRLSDALLVKKVYICGNTIIPPNKKIKASSRGAEKWVQWEYREDIISTIKELKSNGVFIIAAEVSKNSVRYDAIDYKFPLAIILGREYDGVSEEALNLCDKIVELPIFGMCNSINVSTTASVLMYHSLGYIKNNMD